MKRNGFTLFELLVSISIIAILIAIASFSYSAAQKKARDARRTQDMEAIQKAAEQYYSMSGGLYPTAKTVAGFTFGGQQTLQIFPVDPKNSGSFVYTLTAVGGGALSGTDYCACAYMDAGATSGNSSANCNSFGTPGGYFCVRNQQ